ncbi:hypothetical protein [Novosphingobium sp. FKTRR1]|uniref:hypothetical protein n=1 Tax=Novosphingobium sp. FKTRR1 TaxID=2879118 RepID=UPI001CF03FC4|nr:hypothetical protein [Novosphingobium sp. FKTRR1]
MSTNRLTDAERASFLIGEAFRRVLTGKADSLPAGAVERAWQSYGDVLTAALTPDEIDLVMINTGITDPRWIDLAPPLPTGATHDILQDDLPF